MTKKSNKKNKGATQKQELDLIVYAKHPDRDYPFTILHKKYQQYVLTTEVGNGCGLTPSWLIGSPDNAVNEFLLEFVRQDYDFSKVVYNPANKELTDLFIAKTAELGWVQAPAELFS